MNKKCICIPVSLCLLVLLSRCSLFSNAGIKEPEEPRNLAILSWNVQALFDGGENGTEYAEYTASGGWSREKFDARLNAIARAFGEIPEDPDIIGLLEVENGEVLERLVSSYLPGKGYNWTFFARNSGGTLGLGIISRHPLIHAKSHAIVSGGELSPRPMAEVWVEAAGSPLVLLVCHWKSKLGGEAKTEALRRAAARIALRRVQEIERDNPGVPVILMGDLNENYDEFYRSGGTMITALLPDDPMAAELAAKASGMESGTSPAPGACDFLVAAGDKGFRTAYFPPGYTIFFSPWKHDLAGGSYFYQGNWETIDHMLLRPSLFDGQAWDFSSCRIVNNGSFVFDSGSPAAYNPRTGQGLSDHLPLLLILGLQDDRRNAGENSY